MSWVLIIAILTPLSLAGLAATPLRNRLPLWSLIAPLPALALLFAEGTIVELSWLLLGMRLGIDHVSIPFLLLTTLLWLAAFIYARCYLSEDARPVRFYLFFLLTFAGNVGTVLALDTVSFYLFFTLMSFAAYGLITHYLDPYALRAGKIYLILTVTGEALLLAAIILITGTVGIIDLRDLSAQLATTDIGYLAVVLALCGFAIKLGIVPLHVWLPLAHPSAPIPASAILSGILLKMGLLGWLRFIPFGELPFPMLGQIGMLLGSFAVFYGVGVGLLQNRPKTVLAYSSISQMGLMALLTGVALATPQLWPVIFFTLIVFSLHHGFAKATLFLALGAVNSNRLTWLLILPALALVGAPLTSGAVAKLAFKDAVADQQLLITLGDLLLAIDLVTILSLSSIASGLLMLRFLYLAWPTTSKEPADTALIFTTATVLLSGMSLSWWWILQHQPDLVVKMFNIDDMIFTLGLLLLSAVIAVLVWLIWRAAGRRPIWHLPEGDIVALTHVFKWIIPPKESLLATANRPLSTSDNDIARRFLLWFSSYANNERGFLALLLAFFIVFLIR